MKSKDDIRREYVKLGYLLPSIRDDAMRDKLKERMDTLLWVLNNEPFNIENYED